MADRKKNWQQKNREKKSSAAYKKDLEKFFGSGGDVPERFKDIAEKLAPEEGSDEAIWRDAVKALREAEGFRAFVTAVNEFVKEGHAMPGDEDLLLKFLDHPSERVVQLALEKFSKLHNGPGLNRPAPLKNRIRTIRSIAEEPRTHQLLDELEQSL